MVHNPSHELWQSWSINSRIITKMPFRNCFHFSDPCTAGWPPHLGLYSSKRMSPQISRWSPVGNRRLNRSVCKLENMGAGIDIQHLQRWLRMHICEGIMCQQQNDWHWLSREPRSKQWHSLLCNYFWQKPPVWGFYISVTLGSEVLALAIVSVFTSPSVSICL